MATFAERCQNTEEEIEFPKIECVCLLAQAQSSPKAPPLPALNFSLCR